MTEWEAKVKLEKLVDLFYTDGEQHGSIERDPREELLIALTRAKIVYSKHEELIQHYIKRYEDMGDRSLQALLDDGYDVEGMTSDFDRLRQELLLNKE